MNSAEKNPAEKLAEVILRQGELKLAAQLQVAIAADSRASAFAGLFTTLGLACFSGVAVLWKLGAGYEAILFGLILQTTVLLIAAHLSVQAASPIDFYTVGNQPTNWWADGVEKKPLADCLKAESLNYQSRIEKNNAAIARNAAKIQFALRLAILSPLAFLAVYIARKFLFL
jgi:hypothetical protein